MWTVSGLYRLNSKTRHENGVTGMWRWSTDLDKDAIANAMGVYREDVQAHLRHTSAKTTLEHYIQTVPESVRVAGLDVEENT